MQKLMATLRKNPPNKLGGDEVWRIRDYSDFTRRNMATGKVESFDCPRESKGNLIIFDVDELGTRVAVRPSGTEPKVKLYLFKVVPKEEFLASEDVNSSCDEWIQNVAADLNKLVKTI